MNTNYDIAFDRTIGKRRNQRLDSALARLRKGGMDEATSKAMQETLEASSDSLRDTNAAIAESVEGCGRKARRQVAAVKLSEDLHASFDGYDSIAGRESTAANSMTKALIGFGVFASNIIGAFRADGAGAKAMPVQAKAQPKAQPATAAA